MKGLTLDVSGEILPKNLENLPGILGIQVRAGDVGRDEDVFHLPQGAVRGHGLHLGHVQHGAAQMAGTERFNEIILADGFAPAGVEENRPGLHGPEKHLIQNALGFLCQRKTGGDHREIAKYSDGAKHFG